MWEKSWNKTWYVHDIGSAFDKKRRELRLSELKVEAIQKNTSDLLKAYDEGKISAEEIEELLLLAVAEEEYEVAQSLKYVLDYHDRKTIS